MGITTLNYVALSIGAALAIFGLIFEKKRKINKGTPQEREVLSRSGWAILLLLVISISVGFVTESLKSQSSAETSRRNRQLQSDVQALRTDNADLKGRLDKQFQLNQLVLMNQTSPRARAVIRLRTARPTTSTPSDVATEYAHYRASAAEPDHPVNQARFAGREVRRILFMDDDRRGSAFLGSVESRMGDLWNVIVRVGSDGSSFARGRIAVGADAEKEAEPAYGFELSQDALRIEVFIDRALSGALLYSVASRRAAAVTIDRPTNALSAAADVTRHLREEIAAVELFIALDPQAEMWFSVPVGEGQDESPSDGSRARVTWHITGDPTLFIGNP